MRIFVLTTGLLLALMASSTVAAEGKPKPVLASPVAELSPEVAQEYTHPHQLIDMGGGRKMNLHCMGSGGPAVIFDSGLSDWSVIWALVQPRVAKRTLACSYDRAGMGFSDVAPNSPNRSPANIVDDLHTLIHAAKIKTPLILVGHSLGGFNMKLYAATYPEDVAGLVLVDPSEDRPYARVADAIAAKYGQAVLAQLTLGSAAGEADGISHYEECASAARRHDLDPASDLYKQCTDPIRKPLGPIIAAERQRVQVGATYQTTQASELANSVYGNDRLDPLYAKLFSDHVFDDKPLIVLTHSIHDADSPAEAADYDSWNLTHDQTAALSRRGVNRVVPETHHNIEIDRPQAVISAVDEELDLVKGGVRSASNISVR